MHTLLPPKYLSLQQKENSLILSWDKSLLNSLTTSFYIDYRIHLAEESFYDVMEYNYDRLKGYNVGRFTDKKAYKEERLSVRSNNLNIDTTYYFFIIASVGTISVLHSPPSEEISIHTKNGLTAPVNCLPSFTKL